MSGQLQRRTIKVDVNDPLSVTEEVVAVENLITQERFEVEIADEEHHEVIHETDCELTTVDSHSKVAQFKPKRVRRKRSNIWLYFEKGNLTGRCKKCFATIKTAGNTMNMWNHLKRRHPKEYALVQKIVKVDENDGFDPTSMVQQVVTSEKLISEDQFEAEFGSADERTHVQYAEYDDNPNDHPKKYAVKRRPQSLPTQSLPYPVKTYNSHRTTTVSSADDVSNVSNILTGVQQSLRNLQTADSFQLFGNFVAEELRKIPDQMIANQVQRKLTRHLMDCMDEADSAYCNRSNNKGDF